MCRSDSRLVITIPELAQRLGISRTLAYRLAKEGSIPVLKLGDRRLVVPLVEVDRLLSKARD